MLRTAKSEGLPVSAETCPHYLHFASEKIPDGQTRFKCAPPIRDRENRETLWRGLREGVIDLVATDHSPCPPSMKRVASGDFKSAWGGIASLSLALPVMWTEASRRGFSLADIARWMAEGPARLAGCAARKGRLARNFDADFVVFEPEAGVHCDGGASSLPPSRFALSWRKTPGRSESNLPARKLRLCRWDNFLEIPAGANCGANPAQGCFK